MCINWHPRLRDWGCWLGGRREQARTGQVVCSDAFPCDISMPPSPRTPQLWVSSHSPLIFTCCRLDSWEITVATGSFCVMQTMSESQKLERFKAGFQPHYCGGIKFHQGEVSFLRTQISLSMTFLSPLFLKLSNYFFFREKNVLMHKTLSFFPFIYLKLNLTKSVLSKHYLWVMLFVRKEHWLKWYGSAGSCSALCECPQWQSAHVRVDNETINCFHECFEFGLLWGKFKRYLVPHFTYVSNARQCNISSKSRIFSELTWATVVGLLTGLHSWRETQRHTMLLLEGRSSSQHCPAVGKIQSVAKIPTSEVGLWWWMSACVWSLKRFYRSAPS